MNLKNALNFAKQFLTLFVNQNTRVLDIAFLNRKLEKQFSDPTKMLKSFGKDRAKRLSQRLADFEAAANLEVFRNLPAANCHELTKNLRGQLSVNVSKNFRLIFRPDHDPSPTKPDGGLDWEQVTAIIILEIKDYH